MAAQEREEAGVPGSGQGRVVHGRRGEGEDQSRADRTPGRAVGDFKRKAILTVHLFNVNVPPVLKLVGLAHKSPEFDAAYDVISRDILPEYLETRDFLRNRL